VFFKLAVTVHRCLNGRAPPYLSDYCVPAAVVAVLRLLELYKDYVARQQSASSYR